MLIKSCFDFQENNVEKAMMSSYVHVILKDVDTGELLILFLPYPSPVACNHILRLVCI